MNDSRDLRAGPAPDHPATPGDTPAPTAAPPPPTPAAKPTPAALARRQAALDYLATRIDYERAPAPPRRVFKLDRMQRLLQLVGDPQNGLLIIHVAGTKGKGSTAAMIAAALTASGRRTGLFTSPHLTSVEERWKVDDRLAEPDEFADLVATVRDAAEQLDRVADEPESPGRPTFFELTTALALLHFRRRQCDAAVLEVGLGGRLDSTNVCQPAVCVITTISFDHMKLLGNTLAEIAAEKAGIIKPGVPVVTGVVEPEPREVIERKAAEVGAPLFGLESDFRYEFRLATDTEVGRRELDYWETAQPSERLEQVRLGMRGAHQALNGAVAIATLRQLERQGWKIGERAIRHGLAAASCPARVEVVEGRPQVVLDAAHNVASVEALVRVLDSEFAGRAGRLIFAASADKEVERMLERLLPRFRHVYLTCFLENPRSVPPDELAEIATKLASRSRVAEPPRELHGSDIAPAGIPGGATWTVHAHPAEAWRRAKADAEHGEFICVAGSFFLVAELRPLVLLESSKEKNAPGGV